MNMTRIVTLAVAAVFALWTVAPALAQTPSGQPAQPAPATKPEDTAKPADTKADKDKDKDAKKDTKAEKKGAKKHARKAGGKQETASDEHSNKGGQERGLDRADQVAGEHGKQGRDNARAKQNR